MGHSLQNGKVTAGSDTPAGEKSLLLKRRGPASSPCSRCDQEEQLLAAAKRRETKRKAVPGAPVPRSCRPAPGAGSAGRAGRIPAAGRRPGPHRRRRGRPRLELARAAPAIPARGRRAALRLQRPRLSCSDSSVSSFAGRGQRAGGGAAGPGAGPTCRAGPGSECSLRCHVAAGHRGPRPGMGAVPENEPPGPLGRPVLAAALGPPSSPAV